MAEITDDNIAPKIYGNPMRKAKDSDEWVYKMPGGPTFKIQRLDIAERVGTNYRFRAKFINGKNVTELKWSTKLECVLFLERQCDKAGFGP